MKRETSDKLYESAKKLFPGGVNSPVRAFKSVKGSPIFIEKGDGAYIWDADGNKYIDFCNSWGPLILGHNHPEVREAIIKTLEKGTSFGAPTRKENELGELILHNNRFIDKIRFVSSGTEAVMSAIRMARGYTGKNKVLKFEGCYHGHVDSLLVNAGSGLVTLGTSSSAGIPEAYVNETLVAPLGNKEALTLAVEKYKNDLACIIIEPIPANNGLLIQDKEYLEFVFLSQLYSISLILIFLLLSDLLWSCRPSNFTSPLILIPYLQNSSYDIFSFPSSTRDTIPSAW